MLFSSENRSNTLSGILFAALFALSSMYIGDFSFIKSLGISPLVVAILLGMVYGNTLRGNLPHEWTPGIQFSAKMVLRAAIVLYGFNITFQQIYAIGAPALLLDVAMITTTFLIAVFVGIKILGLDRDTAILIGSGSSICGAAAVLATEGTLKSEPYKAAMAVATVVLFGTISMFLYPILFKGGFLAPFTPAQYGIYVGASIHEVAQVVVAGNEVSDIACSNGVIVKMARVMMLAPFLLIVGFAISKLSPGGAEKGKIVIPWFAVYFVGVAGFNSLHLLPDVLVTFIRSVDTFMLAMAMAALGIETNFSKIKNVGMKPLYLAVILFLWLIFGGYTLTKFFI
jgi:uncharacterized integral membrane protein (TIGR00698 family)